MSTTALATSPSGTRSRWVASAVAALGIAALAGCHADVTERITFNSDGSGVVTVVETMDDQFQAMASSRGGSDPFGLDQAKKNGWAVRQSIDDTGNHVTTITRGFAPDDITSALGGGPVGSRLKEDGFGIQQDGNLFARSVRISATVPPLMGKDTSGGGEGAEAGRALAASVFSVHLVVSSPAHVEQTNGEVASDGSIHWNLGMTNETPIDLKLTLVNWPYIIGAAIVVVFVIAAAIYSALRYRAKRNILTLTRGDPDRLP